jgi:hypothetical protein
MSAWPGFVPAIHALLLDLRKELDARHKAGHDDIEVEAA